MSFLAHRYLAFNCLDTENMKAYDDVTFSDGSNDFARRLYHKLTSGPQENMVGKFLTDFFNKTCPPFNPRLES